MASQQVRNAALAAVLSRAERRVWGGVTPAPAHGIPRVCVATFDATGGKTTGSYSLGVDVPLGALVLRSWWIVGTPVTSTHGTATLALTVEGAGDIGVATVVGTFGTAGLHVSAMASPFLTTAERTLTVTVGVEGVLGGVLDYYTEYIQTR